MRKNLRKMFVNDIVHGKEVRSVYQTPELVERLIEEVLIR